MCPPSPFEEHSAHLVAHPESHEHQQEDAVVSKFQSILVACEDVISHLSQHLEEHVMEQGLKHVT